MAYVLPQYAQNHDNVGGLATLSPVPAYPGILVPEVRFNVDVSATDAGGPYTELEWLLTWTGYETLLATLGLTSVRSLPCTIRLEGFPDLGAVNYNGTIVKTILKDNPVFGTMMRRFRFSVLNLIAI